MDAHPSDSPAEQRTKRMRPKEDLPSRIGRYRIEKVLGSGGMGTVFLAEDTQLQRTVALKVLVKSDKTPPNLIQRFHSEARTSAQLRDPHIVTVYDSGEVDGYLFLALEYIDGPDVERVLRKRGPMPPKRAFEIIRQVVHALCHAHGLGIVHRDIKPSNILVRSDGSAALTDMGLARAMGESAESHITRAGFTVGTVDYMAPEQARSSRAADARSDLYSLGCTWYHMLTGRVPYPDGDLTNKLRAHATGPPPDPRDVVPEIPDGIVAVVQRLMAQNPDDRYQTSLELLEDLDQPGLFRQAVTSDDLRGLADDGGERRRGARPRPVEKVTNLLGSDEMPVTDGSTMIDAVEELNDAPPPRKQARRRWRSDAQSRKKPAPRKETSSSTRPAQRKVSRFQSEQDQTQRSRERWFAVVLLGILGLLLWAAIWVFANIDSWIGGGALPSPGHGAQNAHGLPQPGGSPSSEETLTTLPAAP